MSDETSDLIVEDRFAIVPEWLLDADIGDAAVRLFAVLLRYGNSTGARMPSRATLARRLRKRSTDSVDRAMKELVRVGAVRVEHRYDGAQRLTNAYHVRTSRPGSTEPPTPRRAGSRRSAATPPDAERGGGNEAAGVAASAGDNRDHFTENASSPALNRPTPSKASSRRPSSAVPDMAVECAIRDWSGFVAEIQQIRRDNGAPANRWTSACLDAALQLAVHGRRWPADLAADALRRVAADPATRSPMRVAEAGAWWDEVPKGDIDPDLEAMARALLEADGIRVELQLQARRDLEAKGLRVTRAGVIRGAYLLLTERGSGWGAA